MTLTLADIEQNPSLLSFSLRFRDHGDFVLRPLEHSDVAVLTTFLENLSEQTRRFYTLDSFDEHMAQELCDAINRYDKLRFIVVNTSSDECVALFEYSLDMHEDDIARFVNYGIQLSSITDCRMGPCISDAYQNHGLGSFIFPYLTTIAKKLGRQRMILRGGVLSENHRAIAFYKKNGFLKLGTFVNSTNQESVDMIIAL